MCACFTTSVVVQGPEEEVKVPLAEDIEEGEVTSDEEGEIKGRQGNLFAPYVYIHVVITHVPPPFMQSLMMVAMKPHPLLRPLPQTRIQYQSPIRTQTPPPQVRETLSLYCV